MNFASNLFNLWIGFVFFPGDTTWNLKLSVVVGKKSSISL